MNDPRPRKILSFEIGDLKEPWERYCAINNEGNSSDALRQVIMKLAHREIAEAGGSTFDRTSHPSKIDYQVEPVSEKKGVRRLELRLTESEDVAVRERAALDGFTNANQWVVALIRANLTSSPQFGKVEIDALGESNHQLLSIGRNLNQIAKAMNSVKGDRDEYDRELVEELAKAVRLHVKKVGDALRASIFRWKLSK